MGGKSIKSQWVNGDLAFLTAAGQEIFRIDGVNRRMIFPAPGTLVLPNDAITSDDFVADGTITGAKLANATIPATKLDAITSDDFVADGTITGAKLANATIPATKLADGAGLGALISAGLGASANYDKSTAGAQDLAAASAKARACLCVVIVTEAFADGAGTQPTFTIGDESKADSIMSVNKLTDATLGSVFVFAGQVTAAEKLRVTGVAATDDGTGAISVTALLLDEV